MIDSGALRKGFLDIRYNRLLDDNMPEWSGQEIEIVFYSPERTKQIENHRSSDLVDNLILALFVRFGR